MKLKKIKENELKRKQEQEEKQENDTPDFEYDVIKISNSLVESEEDLENIEEEIGV